MGMGGGGGMGAYLKNRDQIINIGMIRHGSCEDTRAECQTYGLTEIRTTFKGRVNLCERHKMFDLELNA